MNTILIYDGTFDGFLSVVFHVYENKLISPIIQPAHKHQRTFFDRTETVHTNPDTATRVWDGLLSYCSKKGRRTVYKAFLSEQDGIEHTLLHYIQRSVQEKRCVRSDFSDPEILKLAQTIKKMGREKHRMEAFIRFRQTKDDVYVATIEPDFNVLPLLLRHFKQRYADQHWLIYDMVRNYGLYYNLHVVTEVHLEHFSLQSNSIGNKAHFTSQEHAFEALWKNYFRSININARKNSKLHHQHLPKRYWKYLSEKHYM